MIMKCRSTYHDLSGKGRRFTGTEHLALVGGYEGDGQVLVRRTWIIGQQLGQHLSSTLITNLDGPG